MVNYFQSLAFDHPYLSCDDKVSSSVGTPPPPFPPLSEANLKSYPLFLRAIQIGARKL